MVLLPMPVFAEDVGICINLVHGKPITHVLCPLFCIFKIGFELVYSTISQEKIQYMVRTFAAMTFNFTPVKINIKNP
jgi:hypothetical protein